MPPIRLGSRDLLEYDARYGVLICRECKYAIQKSALRSHLLKHKIYRDERQRLLNTIAQFNLLEPHQVPLPTPDSPPIEALPLISGYRCTEFGCGNLCTSTKRMRRHQSEVHGLSSEPSDSSSFSRPVKLQTFFRGTKLRYFEVTPSSATGTTESVPLAFLTDNCDEDDEEKFDEDDFEEKMHDVDTVVPLPSPRRTALTPKSPCKSSPLELNLETLSYFHHFTSTTSLTLPSAEFSRPALHYWQTDVIHQALQRRWLMCGLLAIASCHLVVLTEDVSVERLHRERSVQFGLEFRAGWEEITKRDASVGAVHTEEEAKQAGRQIGCLLRCAHWALTEATHRDLKKPAPACQLQSIMGALREFVIPDFTLRLTCLQSGYDHSQGETFPHAAKILKSRNASNTKCYGAFSSYGDTRSALLDRLNSLPARMTEAFGRPQNPQHMQDVFATLSAIAALIECCEISFASDEAEATWWGMTTWLTKISDQFNDMVSRNSPAALVCLAHWACLVRRAEHCGCWFVRGLPSYVLMQVAERLPANDYAVRNLVGGLLV